MIQYHKINTIYKREIGNNSKRLIEGEYSRQEFEYLAGNRWIFTEKVDGTNIRVMFNGGKITFGGKTDNAQIPAPLVERLQDRFLRRDDSVAAMLGNGVCLYGEGYGAKIQAAGGNYRADQDFVLFDVCIGGFWLNRSDVVDIADKLGLDVVPIVGEGTLHDAIRLVKNGLFSQWGNFLAEGIVARPAIELTAKNGDRIITKIKHRDFA